MRHILHAVSIDPSCDSSVKLVERTLVSGLSQAAKLGARTVNCPAVATGFGPLCIEEFAAALKRAAARGWSPVERLKVTLLEQDDAQKVRDLLTQ